MNTANATEMVKMVRLPNGYNGKFYYVYFNTTIKAWEKKY